MTIPYQNDAEFQKFLLISGLFLFINYPLLQ